MNGAPSELPVEESRLQPAHHPPTVFFVESPEHRGKRRRPTSPTRPSRGCRRLSSTLGMSSSVLPMLSGAGQAGARSTSTCRSASPPSSTAPGSHRHPPRQSVGRRATVTSPQEGPDGEAVNPERQRRITELLAQAVELDPGARAEFLDTVCGADEELARKSQNAVDWIADRSQHFNESTTMTVRTVTLSKSCRR